MQGTRTNQSFRTYWELLAAYLRPLKWPFLGLAILLLSSIGLQLLNPQIIAGFIDAALAGAPARQLALAGLAFLGIAILYQLILIGVNYLGENVAWSATNSLREDLARHAMHLDLTYHNQHPPGELIERIDGDVTQLATFFSQFFIILVGNFLLLSGILLVLFFEDWRVGIAFTVFASLSLFLLSRVRDIAVFDQKQSRKADGELFGFIEESLSATEDIRSNGAIDYIIRRLYRHQAELLRHNRRARFKHWLIELLSGGLLTLGMLLAVGSGYLLYQAGAISIGTVYLIVFYINLLEGPIWTLTHEVQSFQTIGACVQRIQELRQLQPSVADGPLPVLPAGPLELQFEQVSFAYDSSEPILNQVSFKIPHGTRLGLLGRTGSGKTTLARLVFRLYDPQVGAISLDNVDIRQLKIADLRRQIGMVTQEVQLFRASVRENLTFFDPSIQDNQILKALEFLELADWYQTLPDGLDTLLAAGGHSLSAGEAQLLAFTRIFLRNPGLVILDEASSRLDPATETRIQRAIDNLLRERTAVIIAHRLGTLQKVNQIMILERGQVIEHGERARLAADHSTRFYQLLQTGLEEVLV